jgi:hypothetical protein
MIGNSGREIADVLGFSELTVQRDVAHTFENDRANEFESIGGGGSMNCGREDERNNRD